MRGIIMRKALVVGIDYYPNLSSLNGCVSDAFSISNMLERHYDGTLNFDVNRKAATSDENMITRAALEDSVRELFEGYGEIALFYFSGHGYTENKNGYLITSDSTSRGIDGMKMDDLITICNKSNFKNKIIILDCCHAGEAGTDKYFNKVSIIGEGVTILSACAKGQYALEAQGQGVFTQLLVDALNGSAANILGQISPGSLYAHIDQSLGPWSQRPVFKTNVESFISLRNAKPSMDLCELRQICTIFKSEHTVCKLNPSYEPYSDCPDEENTKMFNILQKMEGVNLVEPVDEEHMYFAAMHSKACKLTALGVHYWNLVNKNRI